MSVLMDLGNLVRHLLPALTAERWARAQEFLSGVEAADAEREMTAGRRLIREDYGLDPEQRQKFDSHLAGLPDPKSAREEIFVDDLLQNHFGIGVDAVGRHRPELMAEYLKDKFGVEEQTDPLQFGMRKPADLNTFVDLASTYFREKESDANKDRGVDVMAENPALTDVAKRMKELDEIHRINLVKVRVANVDPEASDSVYRQMRSGLLDEATQILYRPLATDTRVRPAGENRTTETYFKSQNGVIAPERPPTLDAVLRLGKINHHGPEEIAKAVKAWRDEVHAYGKNTVGAHNLEGFWMGRQRLDGDVEQVLSGLAAQKWARDHFVTEGGSWDEELFNAWQNNPAHPVFAEANADFEALMKSDTFSSPRRNVDWLPIRSASGNDLGRFQVRQDKDQVEVMVNLPQQEQSERVYPDLVAIEAGAERKEVQPPDLKALLTVKTPTEADVKAAVTVAEEAIKKHREKITFAETNLHDLSPDADKSSFLDKIVEGFSAEDWAASNKARRQEIRDAQNEIAKLEQRKQALRQNGYTVLLTERVVEALKDDPNLKDKVGRRDLLEDFERGFARWVAGGAVAALDMFGTTETRDKWIEHLNNLPLYYEGSSNREFQGGFQGFLRDSVEGLGGMVPQVGAMVIGALVPPAALPFVTASSLGSLTYSAYGQEIAQMQGQVGVLRERAQALRDAGDARGADALSAQADYVEEHYRALAGVLAAEEGISGLILPEERLLTLGGKNLARKLTVNVGKDFLEGFAATGMQAPVHSITGNTVSFSDALRNGALGASSPLAIPGTVGGHLRNSSVTAKNQSQEAPRPPVPGGRVDSAKTATTQGGTLADRSYSELEDFRQALLSGPELNPADTARHLKAETLRDLRNDKPLNQLRDNQLAIIGYARDAQNRNKVIAAQGEAGKTPAVTLKDGKVVVEQAAIDEVQQQFPETAAFLIAGQERGAPAEQRKPSAGDADYTGPPLTKWKLRPKGAGAHMVERQNVVPRPDIALLDQKGTPRYYPAGTARNAGDAHVRLHTATARAGIKRKGGNVKLTSDQLIEQYKTAYADPVLNGIRGDLRTPNS